VEDETDPGPVHNSDLETSKRLYGTMTAVFPVIEDILQYKEIVHKSRF